MTADQAKIAGIILLAVGAMVVLWALYAMLAVYSHNAEVAQAAGAIGQMAGAELGAAMGDYKASYMGPLFGLIVGGASLFGGWKMLGKSSALARASA
ncbi:hypothetical protein TVD_00730 [Thioalkalivibrio versutus]|uniref:Uncharacterized protein n=1 Tax=Thioalkalivibrio versutus TaxID=106634 RepID=A0A0G3FYC2_9GAMM|nr:hypothetical protein [Thioalkalivibrio versutus]AKJ93978.1 hypothetical protein TVD_00730 [Thioalkalivibrio versutus]